AHRGRPWQHPPRRPPGAGRRGNHPHRGDAAGAEPRRCLPGPHRPRRRDAGHGSERGMSTDTMTLRHRLYWGVSDMWAVTQRNLIAYMRIPEMVVFSSIQPILFVLMFRYVFGGAIAVPGFRYVDYMMPGIFVQTVCFGAVGTGVGLAEDLGKGLIERFRSLPMARSAVLTGRTSADFCRNLFVVLLMTVVGVAVGFRSSTGFFSFMTGVFMLLVF